MLTAYYDTNPLDSDQWIKLASFGIDGNDGETGNANWGMTNSDQFVLGIRGQAWFDDVANYTSVRAGQMYVDNVQVVGEQIGYRTFDQIKKALSDLETSYPNIVDMDYIGGYTENGNRIPRVKISTNPHQSDPKKPDILIVGGHHAREWISVEVPLRIAEYLASHYADSDVKKLIDNREIWIIPLINPDGYIYSGSKPYYTPRSGLCTTDDSYYVPRCWRKNRRDNKDVDITGKCFGVNLNRNYPFDFFGLSTSSAFPCDIEYRGSGLLSEEETYAITALIRPVPK